MNDSEPKPSPPRRRRRSLLVLLVLFAVGAGLGGWSMVRRGRQQRAAEAIRALGGKADPAPASLLDTLDVAHFVDLAGLKIGDDDLRHLADLPDVKTLSLSHNRITNEGLAHLKSLTDLRMLDLKYNLGITDEGLQHLQGLKRLRVLVLYETSVTPDGVKKLQEELPNTKIGFQPQGK